MSPLRRLCSQPQLSPPAASAAGGSLRWKTALCVSICCVVFCVVPMFRVVRMTDAGARARLHELPELGPIDGGAEGEQFRDLSAGFRVLVHHRQVPGLVDLVGVGERAKEAVG